MINPKKISVKEHKNFLDKYSELNRADFIIIDASNEQYVGCVNYSLSKNGIEIGKYIGSDNYLGKGIAFSTKKMIEINIILEKKFLRLK